MRPQFRVIFTVSLGKPWLWAQSKAGIRSVAPFFMKAAAASEPGLSTDGGPIELTIDEDAALALRTDLERFLTQ
jgi:hypothetical protein